VQQNLVIVPFQQRHLAMNREEALRLIEAIQEKLEQLGTAEAIPVTPIDSSLEYIGFPELYQFFAQIYPGHNQLLNHVNRMFNRLMLGTARPELSIHVETRCPMCEKSLDTPCRIGTRGKGNYHQTPEGRKKIQIKTASLKQIDLERFRLIDGVGAQMSKDLELLQANL